MYTFFKVLICRCLYYKQKKNLKVMIGKLKCEFRKKRMCNLFFRTQYIKKMIAEERPFLKVQINLFTFWLMFSHMSSWKIHHFFFFKIFFFVKFNAKRRMFVPLRLAYANSLPHNYSKEKNSFWKHHTSNSFPSKLLFVLFENPCSKTLYSI